MRFYSERELTGANVYDSEGLFYGVVAGFDVRDGQLVLRVEVEFSADRPVVNVERLVEALQHRGVNVSGSEPLEYLVTLAREEGLELPVRRARRRLRMLKGLIPVSEVAVVDVKKLGGRTVGVVVLSTPREAAYRGRKPSSEKPRVVGAEQLKGKLVVSLTEGLLGYAEELVAGWGVAGLRVSRGAGARGYVNWIAFLNTLRRRGYTEAYERLAERWNPLQNPRLDVSLLGEIRRLLEQLNTPPELHELLDQFTVKEPVEGSYIDVPWTSIRRIADIIIVE